MAAGGVAGLIVVLGLLGAFGSTEEGALTAPRDDAAAAAAVVLPDAHIAIHGNVQSAMGAFDRLLTEVAALEVVAGDKDRRDAMAMARSAVDAMVTGLQGTAGVDLRTDVGSVTLSVALPSEKEVRMAMRVRGNLGNLQLDQLLPAQAGAAESFQGVELRRVPGDEELRDHVFARPDATTLLFGHREIVQDLIAKKTWKTTAKQAPSRVAAGLRKGATGFVYMAAPQWAVEEARGDRDLAAFATLLGGVDYVLYSVGGGAARVRVATRDAAVGRQVTHLMKAGATLLSMVEPSVDVLVHGVLGVAPLIPEDELDPSLRAILSDEKAVEEVGGWLRKRFGGKATVTAKGSPATVDMELDNAASIGSLLLPLGAGVAAWHMYAPGAANEKTDAPETFD